MLWNDSVRALKGVGPRKAEYLANLGIRTIRELLYHFPRSFADRSVSLPMMQCADGEKATVRAVVESIYSAKSFGNRPSPMKVSVSDPSGRGEVVFFNATYLKNTFQVGETYCFYGAIRRQGGRISIQHPEFCHEDDWHQFSKLTPVYPLSAGITQNDLRTLISEALRRISSEELLPLEIRTDLNLMDLETALPAIHWPEDRKHWEDARRRFAFEELLSVQLALLIIRGTCATAEKMHSIGQELSVDQFLETLPFQLTNSQKDVLADVESDIRGEHVMNRLVQGDVGSGKTVLAAAAAWLTARSGYQAAVMAPTDILARQHFRTFNHFLEPLGIPVGLLTASSSDKKETLNRLSSGEMTVVVGTHALIQETVAFDKLALVITDEQHRFGVRQRGMLSSKGDTPDVLFMSATPIPRTLSLVLYGDVDVSYITEMPAGRLPIKTHYIREPKRADMLQFIRERMDAGEQVYVVCPLVAESEHLEAVSAEKRFDDLRLGSFKGYRVGLLHGQMKNSEKEEAMARFVQKEVQLLVSTTVIEVGVDVPDATVMVIEDSERFGLSQLHQLRGRVGRGDRQSWCFLMSRNPGEIAKKRIQTLVDTNNGMEIAQRDLELRGPGEIIGTRQHGIPDLKIASLFEDADLLTQAQEWALRISRGECSGIAVQSYVDDVVQHFSA